MTTITTYHKRLKMAAWAITDLKQWLQTAKANLPYVYRITTSNNALFFSTEHQIEEYLKDRLALSSIDNIIKITFEWLDIHTKGLESRNRYFVSFNDDEEYLLFKLQHSDLISNEFTERTIPQLMKQANNVLSLPTHN